MCAAYGEREAVAMQQRFRRSERLLATPAAVQRAAICKLYLVEDDESFFAASALHHASESELELMRA